jgi:hypothetical protein
MKQKNSNCPAQVTTRDYTITPPAIAEGQLHPEFAGYKKIRELFDLSRTHLYRLSCEGRVRSVCLRERGKIRGRRLYDVQSVRNYLAANLETEVAND